MSYSLNRGRMVLPGMDILILEMKKEEIVNLQFDRLLEGTKDVENGPTKGLSSLAFSILGYDEDPRELYEIDKVRRFFSRLIKKVPHFLFFINPINQMPFQIIGSLSDVYKWESEEDMKNNRHNASFFLEASMGYLMIDSIESHMERIGFSQEQKEEASILLKSIEWSIPQNDRREGWELRYV